jgi:endonuclease III
MDLTRKALKITELLEEQHKSPRHHNKRNALNELLFIILSLRTDERIYLPLYKDFKNNYPKWSDVYQASQEEIANTIYKGGLAKQKARWIKEILYEIKKYGEFSFNYINSFDDSSMEEYLTSLPGVGIKTARCVMMFSFNRLVLPVDTHTYRISRRVGLIGNLTSENKIHHILHDIVPAKIRYRYHVNCVAHGRSICKAIKPNCENCVINELCGYYSQTSIP